MPADTSDQQITYPIDGDSADNPAAFLAMLADVEPRLVREYTTEADRTTRMTALAANDISTLSAPSVGSARAEVYNGSDHISLFTRALYANVRKAADEALPISTTTLQNDDELFVPLPTAGTFAFEGRIIYDSATAADIKFAFTIPAGASFTWGIIGPATTVSSGIGDGNFNVTTSSATALTAGGSGVGVFTNALLWGEVTMGGTAGNLQLQWAQNTSDATVTTVRARSRLLAWREL